MVPTEATSLLASVEVSIWGKIPELGTFRNKLSGRRELSLAKGQQRTMEL